MTTDIDLDQLETAAKAASWGLWEAFDDDLTIEVNKASALPEWNEAHTVARRARSWFASDRLLSINIDDLDEIEDPSDVAADATFIAAARPEVVLALIERLRKAEAPRAVREAEGERHAGYLQLHELVRDAPDGVQRAVGNDQQRVLANGSFSLRPSMLRLLLVRAYEQGLAYSTRSVAPTTDVRPRGPISDAQVLAALNATVKPEAAAPDLSYWGDTHTAVMRAALEAAEGARS